MSPIIGLTDGTPTMTEVGRIRKGGEKEHNRPGKNLEHFRVTWRKGEQKTQAIFENAHNGSEVKALNCTLAYDAPEECFWAFYTAYLKGGM